MIAGTLPDTIMAERKNRRDRVDLRADPEWVRRSIEEASRLGLGLSAFIRMVVSQYLDRAESERASQPKSRKS